MEKEKGEQPKEEPKVEEKKPEPIEGGLPKREDTKDMVSKWIGQVVICGSIVNVYLTDWRQNPNQGQFFGMFNKIYISKHLPPHQQLCVLVHEMLHSILSEYQMEEAFIHHPYKAQELIVTSLDAPVTNDILLSPTNTEMYNKLISGKFSEVKE